MKKQAKDRLDQILLLKEEIRQKEDQLESLLMPETVVPAPTGFSLSDEVLNIIKNSGLDGISRPNILSELQKKYPDYGKTIDKKQIASTLAYLKNNKGLTEIISRGTYRIKENENSLSPEKETQTVTY